LSTEYVRNTISFKQQNGRPPKKKPDTTHLLSKKKKADSYLPTPFYVAQRQRAEPPSPVPSEEQMSGESYFSDSTSTSSILSNHPSNPSPIHIQPMQNNSNEPQH